MSVPSQIADLRFPVILWRKGYSYVARTPLELCTHPRRLLADTEERSKRGEFSLLDSAGRVYSVSGFAQIVPFGGLMRFAHFILRSAYAAPVLGAPDCPAHRRFQGDARPCGSIEISRHTSQGYEFS